MPLPGINMSERAQLSRIESNRMNIIDDQPSENVESPRPAGKEIANKQGSRWLQAA
jgi:hypothetical protein